MWRKLVLNALLAVLIVEWVDSIPMPTSDDEDSSFKERQYDPTQDMFLIMGFVKYSGPKYLTTSVLNNSTVLMDFQLQKTREIAENVLADPAISGVNTQEMLKERKILEKYVKKATKAAKLQLPSDKPPNEAYTYLTLNKEFVIQKFYEYVRDHNVTESDYFTSRNDAEKVVWNTLLQHGLEEYKMELFKRMNNFGTQFADDVLLYVSALTPEDRIKEKKLVELCKDYERDQKLEKWMFGYQLVGFFMNVL